MSRSLHRTLPALLCLLVATWGTCPCVFARMVGIVEAKAGEPAPEPAPCGCCKTRPGAGHEKGPAKPEKCPCCERGGWLRDLPPAAGDVTPVAPAAATPLVCAVDTRAPAFVSSPAIRESTGPPGTGTLHACPVGIVLLLI